MAQEIQVLHVDDDPSFGELVVDLLEEPNGHISVATETSVSAAIGHITRTPPDCILSDYQMPEMNGIEFLETIREEFPALPFLLLTGRGDEELASKAIAADATDYLPKTVVADQKTLLANRIQNAVQQYRAEQQLKQNERRFNSIFQDPNVLIGGCHRRVLMVC